MVPIVRPWQHKRTARTGIVHIYTHILHHISSVDSCTNMDNYNYDRGWCTGVQAVYSGLLSKFAPHFTQNIIKHKTKHGQFLPTLQALTCHLFMLLVFPHAQLCYTGNKPRTQNSQFPLDAFTVSTLAKPEISLSCCVTFIFCITDEQNIYNMGNSWLFFFQYRRTRDGNNGLIGVLLTQLGISCTYSRFHDV